MHIVVAWEIRTSGTEAERLEGLMRAQLKGYSWVRALPSVYIVNVDTEEERMELGTALQNVCQENGFIRFIYSPAMTGGRYNGWLPRDLWEKIRARTK